MIFFFFKKNSINFMNTSPTGGTMIGHPRTSKHQDPSITTKRHVIELWPTLKPEWHQFTNFSEVYSLPSLRYPRVWWKLCSRLYMSFKELVWHAYHTFQEVAWSDGWKSRSRPWDLCSGCGLPLLTSMTLGKSPNHSGPPSPNLWNDRVEWSSIRGPFQI